MERSSFEQSLWGMVVASGSFLSTEKSIAYTCFFFLTEKKTCNCEMQNCTDFDFSMAYDPLKLHFYPVLHLVNYEV